MRRRESRIKSRLQRCALTDITYTHVLSQSCFRQNDTQASGCLEFFCMFKEGYGDFE